MPKDFRERVVFYYNTFAGVYDLTEFFRRGTRKAIVRASGCQPGDRVLEICAGTCELALAFARAGVQTAAVDLAQHMLRIGKKKSTFPHLDFLEADALLLPFPENSFGVVVISLALHHMPEPIQVKVISEMTRLALDKVIMLEWHTPETPVWKTLKGLLIRMMDVSEYIQPWMHQDFPATCQAAGLTIEQQELFTLRFHRMTVCRPILP
jgi:ubiquinone/menaquinone biosynthesis C-methylase UbiE